MAGVDKVSVDGSGDCEDKTVGRSLSKNLNGATGYLTPKARQVFTQLRQAFTKAPILQHFNPKCHIRIEIDASGYAIGGVLSRLINSGQWHPVVYYSQKMIPAKTRYKTHNNELLAIVEAFKTWRHYLKNFKHEMLMLTNHNNLCRFMETKNLSSCQLWWAHKLSRYYYQIDYCQGKANGAADALFRFPQRNNNKEKKLWAKNTRILYCLQSSLTNAILSGLSMSASLLPLHQVLICGTHTLSQLCWFWISLQIELTNERPY